MKIGIIYQEGADRKRVRTEVVPAVVAAVPVEADADA